MTANRKMSRTALAILKYGLLVFLSCWMLLPFYWMISASLMTTPGNHPDASATAAGRAPVA